MRKDRNRPVPFGPSKELESLLPSVGRENERSRKNGFVWRLIALLIVASIALESCRAPNGVFTPIADGTPGTTDNSEVSASKTDVSTTKNEKPENNTIYQAIKEENFQTNSTKSTRFTSYKISWGAYHPCILPTCMYTSDAGCLLGTGPAIRVSCGDGGSLEFVPRSNCHVDDSSLLCGGTVLPIDSTFVTCRGSHDESLQVEVQLVGRMYRCMKVLNEFNTWNGVRVERGGAVGHQVTVSTLYNNTWSQVVSHSRTAYCSTSQDCMDQYMTCQERTSCEAFVPYVVASVDRKEAVAAAEEGRA